MEPEEIKQLRSDLGWSQAKLANYLGYTAQAVLKWERGMSPPPNTVIVILKKLRSELDERNQKKRKQEFIETLAQAFVTGGLVAFMNYLYGDYDED